MAAAPTPPPPPPAAGFASKNRVAILAELDKEKRKLLLQNQSSTNNPGASIALARPAVNKDFRDHAEQQHIAAQQKAALQMEVKNSGLSKHQGEHSSPGDHFHQVMKKRVNITVSLICVGLGWINAQKTTSQDTAVTFKT
ncbi:SOSS complex subunit C isoform X1 [Hyla sarda]|uniref:SOSS complex subunit C isoform X1 n=1 Tax=Hyla sarda TaxID=327740 RepID=UPI0024C3B5C2|nr:SOSS complex subunit C isoform X1 [Hyla sarda]